MKPEELQNRTKRFALRIINLVRFLEKQGMIGTIVGKQVLRSGTSLGANYRAVCRAKSGKDFISKLSIVIEESDETQFWLELLVESKILSLSQVRDLLGEAGEITAIMTASKNSALKHVKSNQLPANFS